MSDTPRDTSRDTPPFFPPSDDAVEPRPEPEIHGAPEPADTAPTPLDPRTDDAVAGLDHDAGEPETVDAFSAPEAVPAETPVADSAPPPAPESPTSPETSVADSAPPPAPESPASSETPPPAQEPTTPGATPASTADAAFTPIEKPATPADTAVEAEELQPPERAPSASGTPARAVFDPAPPPPRDSAPPPPAEATDPGAGPETLVAGHTYSGSSDAEVAGDPADPEGSAPTAPRSTLAQRWPLLLLPLVVIAVVVAAFSVKRNTDKAVEQVKTTTPGLVTFTDDKTGFSIKYPRSWKRATRPDPEIRFLASNGALDSLLVRVARTPAPFPPDLTAEEAKAVADVVLKRETFAPERILREQPVNVNGAPGYYYLYTFDEEVKTDSGTQKVQGVHAHYFVFQGRRVFALVFQALPTANFDRLAKTFDAMAESFRIVPLASDAPDPTTPPPDPGPQPEPAPPASPESPPPGR